MAAKRSDKESIYHVELKSGEHHYFGSIAAIFTVLDSNDIKISKKSLWNYQITDIHPFANSRCTIRVGKLHRKPGKRGAKVKTN